ncbi:hypothetical protein [Paenibacillus sp. NEAU-GSW1]|uniref:hypothetical protein n=1 Tax=Paenibacillus sp. NEAU-GSW1 TaxID=2682486 RepID=UPI0012E2E22B|nr:hypothetical protein [Paenibacillus sp. NEAU-GSW1]MUT65426.1 hypothetical protein [Paenibacillus sp. NEAU-GSW1]
MQLQRMAATLLALCMMIIAFASPVFAGAAAAPDPEPFRPVQVFDVKAGKVIKSVPNDKDFQRFANDWISSVTGLAPQLTNDDSCSYVYRIPLEKPVTIKVNGINVAAEDVFLFNCDQKPPLLLVFDEQRRPYLLLFSADIKPFVQKVGIPAA